MGGSPRVGLLGVGGVPTWRRLTAALHLWPLSLSNTLSQRTALVTPYSRFLTQVCSGSCILGNVTSLSVTTEQMLDNPVTQRGRTILRANPPPAFLWGQVSSLGLRLLFCKVGPNPALPPSAVTAKGSQGLHAVSLNSCQNLRHACEKARGTTLGACQADFGVVFRTLLFRQLA